VSEFITHNDTGLLVPFLDPRAISRAVLGLLDDRALSRKLRGNARAYAERRLAMSDYLTAYAGVIERLTGENPAPVQGAAPPARPKPAAPQRKAAKAAGPGTGQASEAARRLVASGA
jgi:hypothetical protein